MRDQLLGGRYRLVRQLGEGGMGQVWEAQDETLGRPVAVKVISLLAGGGSRGDEARARFLREARITARLQHPNIVTIHDLGETDTEGNRVPFLVMERVRGEGLDAKLRRGDVTPQDAAQWGAQICDALAEAHDAKIMHRDIKPSNILITSSGLVKVLDFGIARAADPYATADRLTQTGFIVGTPPYMAPEQARGVPEPRSDLYALGCILFEAITGQLPFQAPDTVGYLSAHLTQQPPTPSSVSANIPPGWDDLVLTLLHKDPTQRYPSATELSQALRQLDRAPETELSADDRTRPLTKPGPPSIPPMASPQGANNPAAVLAQPEGTYLAALERFGPPAILLVFLVSLPFNERYGAGSYSVTLWTSLVTLSAAIVLTASLTPRSTGMTRGIGYVTTALAGTGVLWNAQLLERGATYSSNMSLYYVLASLTAAAYCFRDIRTRRARPAHGRSDRGSALTAPHHPSPSPGSRAQWERFGPPVALFVLANLSSDFWRTDLGPPSDWVFSVWLVRFLMVGLLVFTAALTPHSDGVARSVGYVFASTAAIGFVMGVTQGPGPTLAHNLPLYLTATLLSIAAYCYRDVKTRRARSLHGTSAHTTSDTRAGDFGN
ncbi:serine/threonine-protein kinase [Streptomyces sp. O3]